MPCVVVDAFDGEAHSWQWLRRVVDEDCGVGPIRLELPSSQADAYDGLEWER